MTRRGARWCPAFLVGELRRAFEMGFLLFLPFLVIDMVVASVLMSLGMMMLPPSVVSLPFKLIFFVMVDGWRLVAGQPGAELQRDGTVTLTAAARVIPYPGDQSPPSAARTRRS